MKVANKQSKSAHLQLINAFDLESKNAESVRKARRECEEGTTIIDFSSNWSGLITCLDSVTACEGVIAAIEEDAEMSEAEKTRKIAALKTGLARLEAAGRAYTSAVLKEIRDAA